MIRQKKNQEAINMIVGISDMLRHSLTNEPKQFVPLKYEIDMLKKYLEIERARFQEKLEIKWQVQDEVEELAIPPLLLQPIVENAFKHGISKASDKSMLLISIHKENGSLFIEVFNTGSNLPINWELNTNKGIGLSNTIGRLLKLYQNDFKFLIEQRPNGVAVKIRVPAKLIPANENK